MLLEMAVRPESIPRGGAISGGRSLVIVVVIFLRLGHAIAALQCVGDFVDDDVRAHIVDDQMTSNESVLKVGRKVGQEQEEFRRHGSERVFLLVRLVHVDVELARAVVHDGRHGRRIGPSGQHALQLPFHRGSEQLAAARPASVTKPLGEPALERLNVVCVGRHHERRQSNLEAAA